MRVLCALFGLAWLSSTGGAAPSFAVQDAQPGGQLDASPALFAVLAGLNAVGYDAGLDSPTNHPLRAEIRRILAQKKVPSLINLRNFFNEHRRDNWNAELAQYVSWALTVGPPPAFEPKYPAEKMPPVAAALEGLGPILGAVWKEAGLEALWRQAQPAYEQVIAEYHEPVTSALFDVNAYLRNPTSGMRGRRFQIYIDLLGAPNQVHTRNFIDDYYVVITPSARQPIFEIRHAYLHFLLDPLAIRFEDHLDKKSSLRDFAEGVAVLPDIYKQDYSLLASMSLVKAVEARLDRKPAEADQAVRQGFILTGYFYEALAAYEKQELAFRLYLPDMIDAIDLRKESQRLSQVQFETEAAGRTVQRAAAPARQMSQQEKQLDAAEELYRKKELDRARGAFEEVLASAAPKPLHARAFFGLARIAALQKQPAEAQQLFEKTLQMDPEPFEKAWSHVYLARLARAAQDIEAARKEYAAALAVEGVSEGARNAARQEIASLPTIPQTP